MLHPAVHKYRKIKECVYVAPIIRFAVRGGYVSSEAHADDSMNGYLQWVAGHAVERHELPYVMMHGDVDGMLHAFMLNSRRYLHFCRDYVGFFIHHTPLDDVQVPPDHLMKGVGYTVNYLMKAFGNELSPALLAWAHLHAQGNLHPTSVSCMGNGYDDISGTHENLLNISDFQTFWDHEAGVIGKA